MKCKIILNLILCFCILNFNNVQAYEFVNPKNKSEVVKLRDDIYMLKDAYKEFFNDTTEEEIVYEKASDTSNLYWWPIGSEETTVVDGKEFALEEPEDTLISSTFGRRKLNEESEETSHYAIDIANYRGVGVTNVIAAKSGTVVSSSADEGDNCPTISLETLNTTEAQCGGGFGNFVIIQHSDGMFTIYAHLHKNSIKVKTGENVERGQVIGKMGSSGFSTGSHLHFEMRLGENNSSSAVDPLEYVDKDNPRPQSTTVNADLASIKEFVENWEGTGCGDEYQTDTEYIACYGYDNVITIGHGVVWEFNSDKFAKYGITSMSHGTHVSKEIVNQVEDDIFNDNLDSINRSLAANGIDDLKDYQLAALLSRSYQGPAWVIGGGGYPGFVDAYIKHNGKYSFDDVYSREPSIWTDSMNRPNYTNYFGDSWGLYRRRLSEWKLFTTGEIDYFPLDQLDPSLYVWQ